MLVVLFHLVSIETNFGQGHRLLADYWNIGMSGVDLFFVISGFVMTTIMRGGFQRSGSILKFLSRRFTRIYPLYWFFSLVLLAAFLVRPDMMKRSLAGGEVDLLGSFLLLPQDGLPLLMVGWTLVHEMYFYLVFALMLLLPERRMPLLLALWGGAVICANMLMPISGGASFRLIAHPLTLEFIAGCLVAILVRRGGAHIGLPCLMLGILGWLAGYALHGYFGLGLAPSAWFRVLVFGLPSTLVVYGLVVLEVRKERVMPGWMASLGDASYSIYLSHVLVLGGVARVGTGFVLAGDPVLRPVILATLIAVAMLVGMVCHRLLEVPLIRAARRLLS